MKKSKIKTPVLTFLLGDPGWCAHAYRKAYGGAQKKWDVNTRRTYIAVRCGAAVRHIQHGRTFEELSHMVTFSRHATYNGSERRHESQRNGGAARCGTAAAREMTNCSYRRPPAGHTPGWQEQGAVPQGSALCAPSI